jgi:hypothetical protein
MVRVSGVVFCAFVVAMAGCEPESRMITVTGTVTIDGKAPENGSISFIPLDGMAPTAGAVIEDGKYKSEAPLGESKVEIRVPKVVGKKKLYDTPDSPEQEIMEEVLPEKYNEASELRFTGVKGKNEKNFELSTKP